MSSAAFELLFVLPGLRSVKSLEKKAYKAYYNDFALYGEADDPEEMLEADEWYPKDLIGLEARLAEGNTLGLEPGTVVGKVVDVIEVAQWLLKIRLANPVKDADGVVVENSALVPFVDELVPDIDLEGGYLTLDPPGGLIPGL